MPFKFSIPYFIPFATSIAISAKIEGHSKPTDVRSSSVVEERKEGGKYKELWDLIKKGKQTHDRQVMLYFSDFLIGVEG